MFMSCNNAYANWPLLLCRFLLIEADIHWEVNWVLDFLFVFACFLTCILEMFSSAAVDVSTRSLLPTKT